MMLMRVRAVSNRLQWRPALSRRGSRYDQFAVITRTIARALSTPSSSSSSTPSSSSTSTSKPTSSPARPTNKADKFSRAEFWDGMSAEYDGSHYGQLARQLVDELVGALHVSRPIGRALRVLDLATGHGAVALRLLEMYQSAVIVDAVDISPRMVEQLARQCLSALGPQKAAQIRTAVMDAHELGFEPNFFDAICCHFSLQFMRDRPRALLEMARVLRPGAPLAVSVWAPLEQCPLAVLFFAALDDAKQLPPDRSSARGNPNFTLSDVRALVAEVECAGLERVAYALRSVALPGSDEAVVASLAASAATSLTSADERERFEASARRRLAQLPPEQRCMAAYIVTARRPVVQVEAEKASAASEADGLALTQQRHFFYQIDSQGRVWRKELAHPERHFGEVRQDSFRDEFFARLRLNDTGRYSELGYAFVSVRGREQYYATAVASPIVFWDLKSDPNRLIFGASLSIPFDPRLLELAKVSDSDQPLLRYPIAIPHHESLRDKGAVTIHGVFERQLAYRLLQQLVEHEDGRLSLPWQGLEVPLRQSLLPTLPSASIDPVHVQYKTAWWYRDE